MASFSFRKSERLYKKKAIQELFDKGSSFYVHPFRVYYKPSADEKTNHQIMFSVSKRNFKNASDRNLIKRRMREAFRLNKAIISGIATLQMVYIYTAKEILNFKEVKSRLVVSFKRFQENEKS